MLKFKKLFLYLSLFLGAGLLTILPGTAFAQATVSEVAQNIADSNDFLPGLITGISYLLALLFGVTGILKLREHVENPNQTPLRVPLIRFLAGGALLALPIVLEAAMRTIYGPAAMVGFGYSMDMQYFTSQLANISTLYTGTGTAINDVLENIITGMEDLPGLITGVAYLLGLVSCVSGVLKVKEHVENPDRIELREGVIRLLIGGALFAIPAIFEAVQNTISGTSSGNIINVINSVLPNVTTYLESGLSPDNVSTCADVTSVTADGIGAAVCNFIGATGTSAAFLAGLSYLFGLVIGVWALLKIRDHVLNPTQTPIWEGVSRLIAAGAFFSLPYVVSTVQATITGGDSFLGLGQNLFSGWTHAATVDAACAGGGPLALDMAMACFMQDIMAPAHILFGHFSFIAGLVFIMIGITRLMKSAQEGARGPGGLGTFMTFITGGILISMNRLVEFFTSTISYASGVSETDAALTYTTGMTAAETQHAEIIIASILQFMIIVGLISFIRGWFIIRDVAEGNQQASLMAGATHVLGGALAINLGPILSAVQATLNLTAVGVNF